MGNSPRQAPMTSTSKDDDWTKVEDRAARRKIQNRRAQRRHREKIREHIAQLQAQVASASRDSTPIENQSETYDGHSYEPSNSRPHYTPLKQEHPSPGEISRIPMQARDPPHVHEDHQNLLPDQWNSPWSYFSNPTDIFDSGYPPTPPQEFSQPHSHSTSPIVCSTLPRPSPQRYQKPAARSPRPTAPTRSFTTPQLSLPDKRNRSWSQTNKPAPEYPATLSIKWEDTAAPGYRQPDPPMPQLSYPAQGQYAGWALNPPPSGIQQRYQGMG